MTADGEAQAGSTGGSSALGLRERLENLSQLLWRDANAGVGHPERQPSVVADANVQPHFACRRELDRVTEQVEQYLPQVPAVGRHAPGHIGGDRQPEEQAFAPRAIAHHLRSEEHTSELQSQSNLVCRLLLEKK